jgi:hypothetical protein
VLIIIETRFVLAAAFTTRIIATTQHQRHHVQQVWHKQIDAYDSILLPHMKSPSWGTSPYPVPVSRYVAIIPKIFLLEIYISCDYRTVGRILFPSFTGSKKVQWLIKISLCRAIRSVSNGYNRHALISERQLGRVGVFVQ